MQTNLESYSFMRAFSAPIVPATDNAVDTAERLAPWLSVLDAVDLHATHQALPGLRAAAVTTTPTPVRSRGAATQSADLAVDLQQARAGASRSIRAAATQAAKDAATEDNDEAWRQRYLNQQRTLALLVTPLRAHVRDVLSQAAPRLRQLAALDAAWEQLLGDRSQKLLGGTPALLRRRMDAVRASQAEDSSALPQALAAEWQAALLAELELRLAPVAGMVDAWRQELHDRQAARVQTGGMQ